MGVARKRILYAIQGTGNGHLSRYHQLLPWLQEYGEVDAFISGSNYNLSVGQKLVFDSKGLSLFYDNKKGSLDYWETFKNINPVRLYKEAMALPVEKYDWVINDFEFITSLSCKLKRVRSTQMGHQASFRFKNVPFAHEFSPMGKFILKNYSTGTDNIGFHFKSYAKGIFPPLIDISKERIYKPSESDSRKILVYLPQYSYEHLKNVFKQINDYDFVIYEKMNRDNEKNVTGREINIKNFHQDMLSCRAVITAAGFETPSEALYHGKKLMIVPIKGQYEQSCNAQALKMDFGVKVYNRKIDDDFRYYFWEWMEFDKTPQKSIYPANPAEVANYAFRQRFVKKIYMRITK